MTILRWFQVNLFVFDIPPEPLNKDIVNRPTLTIHAEPGLLKAANICCKGRAGELASLVGIDHFGCAMLKHRHGKAIPAP